MGIRTGSTGFGDIEGITGNAAGEVISLGVGIPLRRS